GWNVTVKASEGDAKDTVVLSGSSIPQDGSLSVTLHLDPVERDLNRLWWANLSNGDSYQTTVGVDRQPPELESRSPTQDNVTDPRPAITAEYGDDDVSVAAGSIRLLVNGREVNISAGETSLTEEVDWDLPEGQNNVSLLLVDTLGNSKWYNWSFGLAEQPLILGTEPTGLVRNDMPKIKAVLEDPSGIDFSKTWIGLDGRRYSRNADAVTVNPFSGDTVSYGIVLEPTGFL
ncbi:MAG: hypothetical protein SVU32_06000, partial [Candidatus Nanohaloarchaea archaeon]|nr:hypothetical protein [Candidatus Nanohaloarchaea archaeon]